MASFYFKIKRIHKPEWESDPSGPEQLILVVHTVIGALESVSLSHAWGLRLRWHIQFSGFLSTYVPHQNTRALLFQCDLMLMRGRMVHKVMHHLGPSGWLPTQVTWAVGERHCHLVAIFQKHTLLPPLSTVPIAQTWDEILQIKKDRVKYHIFSFISKTSTG